MDQNRALREGQLAFDEVDSLRFFYFKSEARIVYPGSTYWSKASHIFWGRTSFFWAYWWPLTWDYNWQCLPKSLDDSGTTINPWSLRNRVACNQEPHTMYGAHHSASIGFIHVQSRCNRLHQILGSPWPAEAIWRGRKHSHWEESKTAKRGRC